MSWVKPARLQEAQPLGYVEDAFEARTTLEGFSSPASH